MKLYNKKGLIFGLLFIIELFVSIHYERKE